MSQVFSLQKKKHILDQRWVILRLIREFFWSQQFVEVETPLILCLPGQEPYLSPMKLDIHNERGEKFTSYLHTSPEYAMKKMLAAGYEKIFSLGKTFRDYESFGGTHNPEFTMIEWYRAGEDFWKLMDDVESLLSFINNKLETQISVQFTRLHMREAWQKFAGVNLDNHLENESMFRLCQEKGFSPNKNEAYDDLFNRIFLNLIEPHLAQTPTIIHHYPKQMAALSQLSATDPRYAERMEAYMGGFEIANGFTELVDATEQRIRLQGEQEFRKNLGKDVFPLDEDFVEAVGMMPPSAGIALGVDRLVQVFTGCKNIDDVLPLPASELYS